VRLPAVCRCRAIPPYLDSWPYPANSGPDDDTAPLADLGMELDPAQCAAGMAFLAHHPTVDVHAHPGLFSLSAPPLGKAVVREMNSAGMLIDLAHATFAVTKDAVAVSTRPVMISHTNLVTPGGVNHPRLISHEHAALVAAAGGIIGSWPSGFGQRTFADYIDSIRRLVDAVGIEHVAIGTDMHGNYRPVFRNYRDWSLIPAALLARDLGEADVSKIMGENSLRIFDAALAHTRGPRES
jgi:hypothetical protein